MGLDWGQKDYVIIKQLNNMISECVVVNHPL